MRPAELRRALGATGAVAGVEPDTPAIPYGTVVREHPTGGPDSTDCWSSGD